MSTVDGESAVPEIRPPDAVRRDRAEVGGAPSFMLVLVGLLLIGADLRVDGFDLLPDAIGHGLVIVGTLQLGRRHVQFEIAQWAALVLALGAAIAFTTGNAGATAPLGELEMPTTAPEVAWVVVSLIAFAVQVVLALSLLAGIHDLAQRNHRDQLAARADRLRLHIIGVSVTAPFVVAMTAAVGAALTIAFVAIVVLGLWLGIRLLMALYSAHHQINLNQIGPAVDQEFPRPMALFLVAAVISALLAPTTEPPLRTLPDDLIVIDTSQAPQPDPEVTAALAGTPQLQIEAPDALASNLGLGNCTSPTLHGIDVDARRVDWTLTLPSANATVVPGDDATVVVTDPYPAEVLPSVSAVDVASGQVRWQRYWEATELNATTPSGPALVSFELVDPWRQHVRVVIDGTGTEVDTQAVDSILDIWALTDPANDAPALVTVSVGSSSPHVHITPSVLAGGPATIDGDPVPFDDVYSTFGNRTSLGNAITGGGEHALMVLGSDQGPNSRIVLFAVATGEIVWQREDVRSATVVRDRSTNQARDLVVYDERNDQPSDAASTRDLYVIDVAAPDEPLWSSALTVNADGGNGFLGSSGDGLVFAVDAPNTSNGFELLVVDPSEPPSVIRAAAGFGGGPGPGVHVGDDLIALATDSGVLIVDDTQRELLVPLDGGAQAVTRVGDRLIAISPPLDSSCGG